MIWWWWLTNGKYVEEICLGLILLLYWYSPGQTEENHENWIMIVNVVSKMRSKHQPNVSQKFCLLKQLARSYSSSIRLEWWDGSVSWLGSKRVPPEYDLMIRIAQLSSCRVTQLVARRVSPSALQQFARFAGSWIPQLLPTDCLVLWYHEDAALGVGWFWWWATHTWRHNMGAIPGRNVTCPGRRPSTPGRKNSSGQKYFNQRWAKFWTLSLYFYITTSSALHVHSGSWCDDYDEVRKVRKCSWPTSRHYASILSGKNLRNSWTS
jgi:hypothetical protein